MLRRKLFEEGLQGNLAAALTATAKAPVHALTNGVHAAVSSIASVAALPFVSGEPALWQVRYEGLVLADVQTLAVHSCTCRMLRHCLAAMRCLGDSCVEIVLQSAHSVSQLRLTVKLWNSGRGSGPMASSHVSGGLRGAGSPPLSLSPRAGSDSGVEVSAALGDMDVPRTTGVVEPLTADFGRTAHSAVLPPELRVRLPILQDACSATMSESRCAWSWSTIARRDAARSVAIAANGQSCIRAKRGSVTLPSTPCFLVCYITALGSRSLSYGQGFAVALVVSFGHL